MNRSAALTDFCRGLPAAALILSLAASARAQESDAIKRGLIRDLTPTQGHVRAEGFLRFMAPSAGRVEDIIESTGIWLTKGREVATIASAERAALLDARGTVDEDTLDKRWKTTFQPVTLSAPARCFILRLNARPRQKVHAGELLAEAIQRLRLVGRVSKKISARVRAGQVIELDDPRAPGRILHATIDEPGETFVASLEPGVHLEPETQWTGRIILEEHPRALHVPASALIHAGEETFLPISVKTGIVEGSRVEILSGVSAATRYRSPSPGAQAEPLPAPLPAQQEPSLPPPAAEPAPAPKPTPLPKRAPRKAREKTPPPAEEPASAEPSFIERTGQPSPSDIPEDVERP
ncbi:MAG: hypothetical protein WCU88_01640 [Elusimicrobiota bacterium]|jgi:hypothetical protein